eukprot:11085278-Lingulodinium_polyedra.AAC.1
MCRSLDRVQEISRASERPFPRQLVIQADNTTAQTKNFLCSLCMAYLVATGKVVTATLNFLT